MSGNRILTRPEIATLVVEDMKARYAAAKQDARRTGRPILMRFPFGHMGVEVMPE